MTGVLLKWLMAAQLPNNNSNLSIYHAALSRKNLIPLGHNLGYMLLQFPYLCLGLLRVIFPRLCLHIKIF